MLDFVKSRFFKFDILFDSDFFSVAFGRLEVRNTS